MSDNQDKSRREDGTADRFLETNGGANPTSVDLPSVEARSPYLPDDQLPNNNPALNPDEGEVQTGIVTAAADAAELEPLKDAVSVENNTTDETEQTRRRKSFWREVLETVILTILIFFMVKSLVQNFRIQGSSMEPNFHTNQLLLVNKAAYFHFDLNAWLRVIPGVKADGTNLVWFFGGPHRGDVVVLEPPDVPTEDYIKRVIALPGEKVEVRDGIVYINDIPLKENYIKEKPYSTYGPTVVPPNNLFVMGDNRNASRDSRVFGFLPVDKVVGKSMFIYWPFGSQWGLVPESKYE